MSCSRILMSCYDVHMSSFYVLTFQFVDVFYECTDMLDFTFQTRLLNLKMGFRFCSKHVPAEELEEGMK